MPNRSAPLSLPAIRKLVKWYRAHKRDMPWRKTRDPYKIWVSEILLQQTQVATVKPYYLRFLNRFPTVHALAAAPLDDVLKAWEGCGYYARARHLHKAAKIVAASGGRLPSTSEELKKLPGIGTYTAAAIASLCYDEAVAVVDGNVERVLARVLCERRILKSSPVLKRVQRAAQQIMQTSASAQLAPADLNQALMELGATLCQPKHAACSHCPLHTECRAHARLADVTVLPKRAPRKKIPHYHIGAAIIRKNGKILITQRPHAGLLGGLWEFPGGKVHAGESLQECVAREIQEELGLDIQVGEKLVSVNHGYSHFTITLHCFFCTPRAGRIRKLGVADFRWVTAAQLEQFAFPKADRVVLKMLQNRL
jgi:A/G-specific adenine glycosylase